MKWYHKKDLAPIFLLSLFSIACSDDLYDPPQSPEETVAGFTISPEFAVDIFAAEPLVADPVEMIFDQKGRIYVVEMPDYPFKPEPGKGTGRIKQLFDDNRDGRIDRATVFADKISEATSIHPWRDGFLVTAAPHIMYLQDTDGDGRADSTQHLFSGFFENNSEAQITNLKFMPDNWIYAANNGQGGDIKYWKDSSGKTFSVAGGDFRFRLDRDQYQLVSGPAQFGQAFNDRIHKFVTQNTLHIRQPVIPWKYLYRNPYLPVKNATVNISDHELEMFQLTPAPYWRAERTRRRQKSYDEQDLGRIEYAEDHFTGASGGTFYGGHTFPPPYYGSIFTGDVAGNLIHRDILTPLDDSPTYVASRAETEKSTEFLASVDSWFRPVNFTVGPDGFLYVIDFYRQHIETPLSIPEDLKEDMDFLEGSDRGRIYRIRPAGQAPVTDFEDLSQKSGPELISLLGHPNRWHRFQAHRLILERADVILIDPLKQLFLDSDQELTRLHAFYCLEALGACDRSIIEKAVGDTSPTLREQGLILAETLPDGLSLVLQCTSDPDIRVAFQACLSLGQFEGPEVKGELKTLLQKHYQDPWFQMAILSTPAGSSLEFLTDLTEYPAFFQSLDSMKTKFLEDLAFIVGNRQDAGEVEIMQKTLVAQADKKSKITQPALFGFLNGSRKAGKTPELDPVLQQLLRELKEADPDKWKDITG